MKKVFIASFDLEIGGVERSLISMLKSFDYDNNSVDLMLYRHTGEFLQYLDKRVNLLEENKIYKTIREGVLKVFRDGHVGIGVSRIRAKLKGRKNNSGLDSVVQLQYMSKYSVRKFPKIKEKYDIAISYLWPHHFVNEKIDAKVKIAWIHTDYSMVYIDKEEDFKVWNKYDYIFAVSEECRTSFLKKYPKLLKKVLVLENITSPEFIRENAKEKISEIKENKDFNIVTVARLSYAKGIDNAVKALKVLHDKGYTNIKWFIVGYGENEEQIKSLIEELNLKESFVLLGKKLNPYPYIKRCDLYVQPSLYEGKAVTVTEAQILGKPIIITNYSTAKSQVNHLIDGYIASLSVNGIATGIEELFNNEELREVLAKNCESKRYSNKEELNKLYALVEDRDI